MVVVEKAISSQSNTKITLCNSSQCYEKSCLTVSMLSVPLNMDSFFVTQRTG